VSAVLLLPDHVSLTGAWHLAAAAGRLNVVTTTFDVLDGLLGAVGLPQQPRRDPHITLRAAAAHLAASLRCHQLMMT